MPYSTLWSGHDGFAGAFGPGAARPNESVKFDLRGISHLDLVLVASGSTPVRVRVTGPSAATVLESHAAPFPTFKGVSAARARLETVDGPHEISVLPPVAPMMILYVEGRSGPTSCLARWWDFSSKLAVPEMCNDDKILHCATSCKMSAECGSVAAGIGWDLIYECIADQHTSQADIWANQKGREFASEPGVDCYTRCKDYFGGQAGSTSALVTRCEAEAPSVPLPVVGCGEWVPCKDDFECLGTDAGVPDAASVPHVTAPDAGSGGCVLSRDDPLGAASGCTMPSMNCTCMSSGASRAVAWGPHVYFDAPTCRVGRDRAMDGVGAFDFNFDLSVRAWRWCGSHLVVVGGYGQPGIFERFVYVADRRTGDQAMTSEMVEEAGSRLNRVADLAATGGPAELAFWDAVRCDGASAIVSASGTSKTTRFPLKAGGRCGRGTGCGRCFLHFR